MKFRLLLLLGSLVVLVKTNNVLDTSDDENNEATTANSIKNGSISTTNPAAELNTAPLIPTLIEGGGAGIETTTTTIQAQTTPRITTHSNSDSFYLTTRDSSAAELNTAPLIPTVIFGGVGRGAVIETTTKTIQPQTTPRITTHSNSDSSYLTTRVSSLTTTTTNNPNTTLTSSNKNDGTTMTSPFPTAMYHVTSTPTYAYTSDLTTKDPSTTSRETTSSIPRREETTTNTTLTTIGPLSTNETTIRPLSTIGQLTTNETTIRPLFTIGQLTTIRPLSTIGQLTTIRPLSTIGQLNTNENTIRPLSTIGQLTTNETTIRPLTTKETTINPVTTKEITSNNPLATMETTTNNALTTKETTTNNPITTKETTTNNPITTKETTTNNPLSTKETTTNNPLTTKETTTNNPLTTKETTTNNPLTTKETTNNLLTTKETTTNNLLTTKETTSAPLTIPKETTLVLLTTKETTLVPLTTKETTLVPLTTKETTIVPLTTKETTIVPLTTKETTTSNPINMAEQSTWNDSTTSASQLSSRTSQVKPTITTMGTTSYKNEATNTQAETKGEIKTLDETKKDSLTSQVNDNLVTVIMTTNDAFPDWQTDMLARFEDFAASCVNEYMVELKENVSLKVAIETTGRDIVILNETPSVTEDGKLMAVTFYAKTSVRLVDLDVVPAFLIVKSFQKRIHRLESMFNCNVTDVYRGLYRANLGDKDNVGYNDHYPLFSTKYEPLIIALIGVLVACLFIVVVAVVRVKFCAKGFYFKDRREIDRERLKEVCIKTRPFDDGQDLTPASEILHRESNNENGSIRRNGKVIVTIRSDDAWVVPFKDVPLDDKTVLPNQDTKL